MRCGGTFFIYTKKLLTCLAWLANLCATNFPCLRVWEKITTWKASERDLTSSMRWPKEAKDSWLLQRALITTSEYPSKTIERKPRSWANFKALSAASASNSATKGGREIFFFFFFFFPKIEARTRSFAISDYYSNARLPILFKNSSIKIYLEEKIWGKETTSPVCENLLLVILGGQGSHEWNYAATPWPRQVPAEWEKDS